MENIFPMHIVQQAADKTTASKILHMILMRCTDWLTVRGATSTRFTVDISRCLPNISTRLSLVRLHKQQFVLWFSISNSIKILCAILCKMSKVSTIYSCGSCTSQLHMPISAPTLPPPLLQICIIKRKLFHFPISRWNSNNQHSTVPNAFAQNRNNDNYKLAVVMLKKVQHFI